MGTPHPTRVVFEGKWPTRGESTVGRGPDVSHYCPINKQITRTGRKTPDHYLLHPSRDERTRVRGVMAFLVCTRSDLGRGRTV